MEITVKNEMRLYALLEKKLSSLGEEVGYDGLAHDKSSYQKLLDSWDSYLKEQDILVTSRYMCRGEVPGKVALDDPLYTESRGLLVPQDFAEKALVLGIVP